MKKWLPLIIIGIIIFFIVNWGVGVNNEIIDMKGQAGKTWANVESSYQRRNDLIGNLVSTVKAAADFEKGTLVDVIEARSKATSTTIDAGNLTPEKLAAFQQAQGGLTSALGKLMVVVERYPELKANKNFLELQSQLEGTENRISVARNRFNTAAGDYNIFIEKIPTNFIANFRNFTKMALYKADMGSNKAVDVGKKFKE